ncbi:MULTISPECIES: hypothetical protein [Pseudoalteromonas]|uniref:hypothetical protein n=1 Tax=Pseudoalteromonas TaxID=53246 RepID=UPI001EF000D2|nr:MULTISPECIES: hypothetical protein [Pseudoalteromonas]MCF6144303.1 hypothetical protein [Pseudoalteromonas mariniglutinosa NCIMB 1770]BDF95546.1 hypothetical protein KAN5_23840 [Pseudoalteromonas sp. KAN5]
MDYFLWVFPVLFLFSILIRFSAVSDLATSLVNISRNWLLTIIGFIFIIGLFVTYSELKRDSEIKKQIDAGDFSVVSGCIQNYRLDKVKRQRATFEVDGVEFSFNSYTKTPFFYEKELPGKVVKNGSCLEVSYLPISKENKIIKIVKLTK